MLKLALLGQTGLLGVTILGQTGLLGVTLLGQTCLQTGLQTGLLRRTGLLEPTSLGL